MQMKARCRLTAAMRLQRLPMGSILLPMLPGEVSRRQNRTSGFKCAYAEQCSFRAPGDARKHSQLPSKARLDPHGTSRKDVAVVCPDVTNTKAQTLCRCRWICSHAVREHYRWPRYRSRLRYSTYSESALDVRCRVCPVRED